MEAQETQNWLVALKSAVDLLDSNTYARLQQEVAIVLDHLKNPQLCVAVLGPFNYGKSTLLNALLGASILPMDVIATTGTAIRIRYGEALSTCVQFRDGSEKMSSGIDLLQQYSVLPQFWSQAQAQPSYTDVAIVEVRYPHPLLKMGVEFLDLPGTEDGSIQDDLIRNQLLRADLVIQLLDARKLMSLSERENLQTLLFDRQMKAVVFVVNFLNLLKSRDQQRVLKRLKSLTQNLPLQLPAGMNRVYRVDALPALRARLKSNQAAGFQNTGLEGFEAALYTFLQGEQEHQQTMRRSQLSTIASALKQILQEKIHRIKTEMAEIEEQKYKQRLLEQEFRASVARFRNWLEIETLLKNYLTVATVILQSGRFKTWELETLKAFATGYQAEIIKWASRLSKMLTCDRSPATWTLIFPDSPQVVTCTTSASAESSSSDNLTPVAIATGLGWMMGGPLGAAVLGGAFYVLNQPLTPEKPNKTVVRPDPVGCTNSVKSYLEEFSSLNLAALQHYETEVLQISDPLRIDASTTSQENQLKLLQTALNHLG